MAIPGPAGNRDSDDWRFFLRKYSTWSRLPGTKKEPPHGLFFVPPLWTRTTALRLKGEPPVLHLDSAAR